jgi:hypothetical protein
VGLEEEGEEEEEEEKEEETAEVWVAFRGDAFVGDLRALEPDVTGRGVDGFIGRGLLSGDGSPVGAALAVAASAVLGRKACL